MDLTALKKKVVMGSRIIHQQRLVEPVGHISARVPGTQTFITTARRSAGFARLSELLVLDFEGRVLEGSSEPNSEWPIHSEIYRARPDVGAIAHIHPFYGIILGIVGQRWRPVHNWGATFHAGVGLYDEVGFVRDQEQGRKLAAALGEYRGVMMRGHGATIVGATVEEAVVSSIEFEYNAHLQVVAMSVGSPIYYTPEQAAPLVGNPPRLWEYYAALVQGELDRPLSAEEQ